MARNTDIRGRLKKMLSDDVEGVDDRIDAETLPMNRAELNAARWELIRPLLAQRPMTINEILEELKPHGMRHGDVQDAMRGRVQSRRRGKYTEYVITNPPAAASPR